VLNSSMRLFPLSATQTFPEESIAMPDGEERCPFPLPVVPTVWRHAPLLLNSNRRLL